MTRSYLQFVGSACTVVWVTLLMGTLFSASADANPSPAVVAANCLDCYVCNATQTSCSYKAGGRGCSNTGSCTCNSNNGNPVCSGS